MRREACQAELRADGGALTAALDRIEAAPPLAPLASQVGSAASAVRAAAQRLTTIVPPTPYAAAQSDLVSALDQLARQLSGVQAQVQSRELCAAPPVMSTLSSLPGADALRRVAPRLGPAEAALIAALPAPEPLPDRQENNGTVLRAPGPGRGEITAENVPGDDSVVTLAQGGRAIGSFYVTRGETTQMTNIPDGTYDIFFTSGIGWDGSEFTRSCTFQRFDKPATFTTTETQNEVIHGLLTFRPALSRSSAPRSSPRQSNQHVTICKLVGNCARQRCYSSLAPILPTQERPVEPGALLQLPGLAER
jgi:hypothetical protein